jgi:hypothetical protein
VVVTRRPERVEFDSAQPELRALLQEWDPIGVYTDDDPELCAPDGEYDSMIPGLYKRLQANVSEDELASFIGGYDFGLPARPEADRRLARQLLTWWAGRSQRQSEE